MDFTELVKPSDQDGAKRNIVHTVGANVLAGGIVAAPLMLLVGVVWAIALAMQNHGGTLIRAAAPIVLLVWAGILVLGICLYLAGRVGHSYAAGRRRRRGQARTERETLDDRDREHTVH